MKKSTCIAIMILALWIPACTQPAAIKSPPGYDLNKPEVYKLPASLNEVSGIAFRNGNPDTLYAEQDEEGKLFYLKPGDATAHAIKFGKKGDYEDLGFYKDNALVLRSDGTIFLFSLSDVRQGEASNVTELKDILPDGEYEAMEVDQANGTIYVLCKECPDQKKERRIPGYKITASSPELIKTEPFFIDEKQLEGFNGGKKLNLKTSAITKNPLTGEWYILSAVNKMLIVTDDRWKVKDLYPLSPAYLFPQPEGIAFDANNNLYISNEGSGTAGGTVLLFKRK